MWYTIQKGDTGASIANAQTPPMNLALLMAANPGVNWDNLVPNNKILLPIYPTEPYKIQQGDTGRGLAGRLGIEWSVLENLNPGTIWTQLEVGKELKIPKIDENHPHMLKDCVGAPVMGVPAQMQPPKESSGRSLDDKEAARVTNLIGGSKDEAAIGLVKSLDWPGCFYLILSNQGTLTMDSNKWPVPQKEFSYGAPDVAVVDLRDPNNKSDTEAVPWKVPGALMLPCIENKSNKKPFDDAVCDKKFASLFEGDPKSLIGWRKLRDAVFVDTHGFSRAPEMATRYAQWLISQRKNKERLPNIWVMRSGMAAYCNPQSFGRVLLLTPNAFITGWPKSVGM